MAWYLSDLEYPERRAIRESLLYCSSLSLCSPLTSLLRQLAIRRAKG